MHSPTAWFAANYLIARRFCMTEDPTDTHPDAEARHHALLTLHALSGDLDPKVIPGFRSASPGTALQTVAEAPEQAIPVSARLAVLFNLARAGLPNYESYEAEYRLLADSVAQSRGLDVDQLLNDVKESARGTPFSQTTNGRALQHHETAFIGEDVCTTRKVKVGGLNATWIFSEFETDAPFDGVADWVDPRNWPERGPLLFKRMDIVGAAGPVDINQPGAIRPPGDEHWHGVFHEEVQLVNRLNTLLHCDYWRDGSRAAGMTYELNLSLDREINVDRGFLLVTNAGSVRRVKALKMVGFTADVWDDVAAMVCPFWTDWVRSAVEGGSTSAPKPPTEHPPDGTGSRRPLGDSFDAWAKFFGDSARVYVDLFDDVTLRLSSRQYSTADLLDDGARYWSQLAKDWARAWTNGLELLDEVGQEGLDARFVPRGAARDPARAAAATGMARGDQTETEGTIVPVPGIGANDRLMSSDLVSIEAGGAAIAAHNIVATAHAFGDGTYGALVRTTDRSVPSGLYVGKLLRTDGQVLAPIQLYVSRAVRR
jgi:hypothetical protein